MKPECATCHDDNEVLLTCGDGKLRCPPCAIDAGFCLSCGEEIQGKDNFGFCGQCDPIELAGYAGGLMWDGELL